MTLIFKPIGNLDVTTNPSDLPQTVDRTGFVITSGEMTRLKNLRFDEMGALKTRDGSTKINAVAINPVYNIIEQGGVRYALGASVYNNETSIGSGYATAWSSILYNPYNSTTQSVYALNGTDRIRIEGSTIYNWGIAAPTVAPTLAVGALTGLTGDYNAKYSYCRKEGSVVVSESNLSPAGAAAVTLANQSLDISWTASTDSQVTHVRIYRTLTDGALYYLDQDIAIGSTTVDTNTADSALGALEVTSHELPPLGSMVIGPNYSGICFILKDNLVYYCLAKQPDYWPSAYFIEVTAPQFPLVSATFYNGQLYVASKAHIVQIAGTGVQTFFPIPQEAVGGSQSRYGMCAVKGHGIFHVLSDGIYQFSTGADRKISYGQFEKIFRGETAGAMPGISDLSTSWIFQHKNRIYFGYAASGNTYPQHVIVYNLDSMRSAYYDFGFEITHLCTDFQNDRLLAADVSGYIWEIEDSTATDDGGTAIAWDVQSKDYTLSTRAHFPRWIKYDVDSSSATTATGQIILDGTAIQSHTLSDNRSTKRRLITTANGERCSMRISGTGAVSIYAMESE